MELISILDWDSPVRTFGMRLTIIYCVQSHNHVSCRTSEHHLGRQQPASVPY